MLQPHSPPTLLLMVVVLPLPCLLVMGAQRELRWAPGPGLPLELKPDPLNPERTGETRHPQNSSATCVRGAEVVEIINYESVDYQRK